MNYPASASRRHRLPRARRSPAPSSSPAAEAPRTPPARRRGSRPSRAPGLLDDVARAASRSRPPWASASRPRADRPLRGPGPDPAAAAAGGPPGRRPEPLRLPLVLSHPGRPTPRPPADPEPSIARRDIQSDRPRPATSAEASGPWSTSRWRAPSPSAASWCCGERQERRRPGVPGAARQRGVRDGQRRVHQRGGARHRRAGPGRRAAAGAGGRDGPRLHDAPGARRPAGRAVHGRGDRGGAGRLDARRHDPARPDDAGRRPRQPGRRGRDGRAGRGGRRVVRPGAARRRQRPALPGPREQRPDLRDGVPDRGAPDPAARRRARDLVDGRGAGAAGDDGRRSSTRPRRSPSRCGSRTATSTTGCSSAGSAQENSAR